MALGLMTVLAVAGTSAMAATSNPSHITPAATSNSSHMTPATAAFYYQVVNYNSGKCLDVTGRSTANGAHIQQWTCNGGTNQEWYPKVVGTYAAGDIYNFINLNSGKCVDVTGSSTANGAVVEQWPCNGGNNQKWFEQIPS